MRSLRISATLIGRSITRLSKHLTNRASSDPDATSTAASVGSDGTPPSVPGVQQKRDGRRARYRTTRLAREQSTQRRPLRHTWLAAIPFQSRGGLAVTSTGHQYLLGGVGTPQVGVSREYSDDPDKLNKGGSFHDRVHIGPDFRSRSLYKSCVGNWRSLSNPAKMVGTLSRPLPGGASVTYGVSKQDVLNFLDKLVLDKQNQ